MKQRNTKIYQLKKSTFSKANRQLIGFILLLLVFALLCYTAFIMYTEGTLFKLKVENNEFSNREGQNNTGMTTVSIIYKNNSIS